MSFLLDLPGCSCINTPVCSFVYLTLCLRAQLYLTPCDPMDYSTPGSSIHGDSPGKNTGVGCHALLQGILPTEELNPGLPHCRQILYQLSHQGTPRILAQKSKLFFNFMQQRNFAFTLCQLNNEFFQNLLETGGSSSELGSSDYLYSWYQVSKCFQAFCQLTTNSSQLWLEIKSISKAKR